MKGKGLPKSEFVGHGACQSCGSSDGVGWYSDGHGYCFVCQATQNENDNQVIEKERDIKMSDITPLTNVFREIPRRGLTETAIQKYGIDVNMNPDLDVAHRYPYYEGGLHVANKIRTRNKDFVWEGAAKNVELFGQHLFPPASAKSITITEGELDAPSAWLMLGSRYPVVSVTSSGAAVKDCKRQFEYLNSFEDIVICFDKDEAKTRPDGTKFFPGQEAAKKVAELFAPGKCRLMTLEHGKDPNDYRQNKIDPKIFVSEWWKAPKYQPDGLILGNEMWDKIINRPQHFQVNYPFPGLNNKTYGIRLSEFVVVNAPTGVGKTSLLKEIEYSILMDEEVREKGYGIGFLHLEELDSDLALGLMSIHENKRYNLPDTDKTEEELKRVYSEVVETPRVVIYDHFGSNDIEAIISKVRHMVALGCKYIFLDHLSIVVSDQSGDERKQLDEISTRLKTLCMEANIALIAVIHQNRSGQIRGTAGVEQLANIILRLERDLTASDDWRRNVMKVWVDKNRFCGRTGPGEWLFFNEVTGRLDVLDDQAAAKYEEGQNLTDVDMPFGSVGAEW